MEGEQEVLSFWKDNDVFLKGLRARAGAKAYVFYEGPPTANGMPGLHHVEARSFKDLFLRYHQMKGELVERKAGWDTHGLPVELEVEKKLSISGKKQIEEYGVERFNDLCRRSVAEYIGEWERMTERLGLWLDTEHPYRTYDSTYIESVWWSLAELWKKDMLYQGYKVVPYCPRCQTSLSSHELSLGYQDDTPDPSVFVKFFSTEDPHVAFLAWTTTPWTLPGNVALAVHPDEEYVRARKGDEILILASARLSVLEGLGYEVEETVLGQTLVGKRYTTLFEEMPPEGEAFVIVGAPEMVTMGEGTGIVHTAGAYGVADLDLCQRKGIALRHVVGLDGRFVEGQTRYAGIPVKKADPQIIADLDAAGNLLRAETILHTYPFCWRCDSPLLYFALTTWFIKTTAVKDKLLANNASVNWFPAHIRDGRMGNWLENLVDWNLSRSRYWGTPLPIWECTSCDAKRCIGSAKELGLTVADDLHKPFIDSVEVTCESCGSVMKRVPDVIDCWYDSGAMPFAQHHYPFENTEVVDARRPADFICEAIDQTRGWFFSLLAISTLTFDEPAYRNTLCLGHLLDTKGQKMSKRLGNIIDPNSMFDEFGADVTRWFFYSAVAVGSNYRVGPGSMHEIVRRFLLTLWNTYSFFVTYANLDGYVPGPADPAPVDRPILDRWILARLAEVVDRVATSLDRYDANDGCKTLEGFVDDLSKWYVRRSRRRFWKSGNTATGGDADLDKRSAYATLYEVLVTVSRLLAPFMPFVSERIYRNLMGVADGASGDETVSVHLADFPSVHTEWLEPSIIAEMGRVRRLVEDGLFAREEAKLKVRQPLAAVTIKGAKLSPDLEAIVCDELNVKKVTYAEKSGEFESVALDTDVTPELKREGLVRELSRKVNDLRKQSGLALDDRILLFVKGGDEMRQAVDEHTDHLAQETLARAVTSGASDDAVHTWEGRVADGDCWIGISKV